MKILILGGDGMLGHQLLMDWQSRYHVRVTLRQDETTYRLYGLFDKENSYFNVDVNQLEKLQQIMMDFSPDVVINAVGVIKQRPFAKDALPNIQINALLPHQLAQICEKHQARLIHFSTDCIFSGKKGQYSQNDPSDAEDFYGKSKYLGELPYSHCVTIRSSIIGLELSRKASLIEWFLAQTGTIKGFTRAIYTGITTQEMARLIEHILLNLPTLSGVWQVTSESINKYDLLMKLNSYLERNDITIIPENIFVCDRSLNGEEFYNLTGYKVSNWDVMLKELALQIKKRNELTQCKEVLCDA